MTRYPYRSGFCGNGDHEVCRLRWAGPCACTCGHPAPADGRPRLLDLFCCAGGAARGYQLAGFHVTGVDLRPQPRYVGDVFVQGDALEYLAAHGADFDVVHASPPCQDHTALRSRTADHGTGWLLDATRKRLEVLPQPWVIENVPGAAMRIDLMLCGEMFGLRTVRHRWFEMSSHGFMLAVPAHPRHRARTSMKKRRVDWDAGMHVSVTGDVNAYVGGLALGIDWMIRAELRQAIPPAYTRLVGEHLLTRLAERAA